MRALFKKGGFDIKRICWIGDTATALLGFESQETASDVVSFVGIQFPSCKVRSILNI